MILGLCLICILSTSFDALQFNKSYNLPQYQAIQKAVKAVKEPFVHPRTILLQGPPGTGKTHTIVGLLQALFEVSASLTHYCNMV